MYQQLCDGSKCIMYYCFGYKFWKSQLSFSTSKSTPYQGLGWEDKELAIYLVTLVPIQSVWPVKGLIWSQPTQVKVVHISKIQIGKSGLFLLRRDLSLKKNPEAWMWKSIQLICHPRDGSLLNWMRWLRIAVWGCAPTWLADKEICFQSLQLIQVYFSSQYLLSKLFPHPPLSFQRQKCRKSTGRNFRMPFVELVWQFKHSERMIPTELICFRFCFLNLR